MASFKTYQDYDEAKREWLDVPHAVYIQKTGSCVQMTGNEPLVFNDPTVASIIGTMSYNAVSKIQNLNNRFRNTTIVSFKEFRHFKCILDIEEKAFENCTSHMSASLCLYHRRPRIQSLFITGVYQDEGFSRGYCRVRLFKLHSAL